MRSKSFWTPSLLTLSMSLVPGCQAPDSSFRSSASHGFQTRTDVPGGEPSSFPMGTVINTYGDAILSEVETEMGVIAVLRLAGSPADMGDQYGHLVGDRIPTTWIALMRYAGNRMGVTSDAAERKLGPVLDRAYSIMEPYIPQNFRDELTAIYDGAEASGNGYVTASGASLDVVLKRIVAFSNLADIDAFSGDVIDSNSLKKLLISGTSDELDAYFQSSPNVAGGATGTTAKIAAPGRTCSFYAAWGRRSQDQHLFASRNLDWVMDSGLQGASLVTIYVPDDGISYATVGFAGYIEALAGMNASGIVVSEVGAPTVLEKLKGEPWGLRLREVLANAADLETATAYMTNTVGDGFNRPTTIGYNFMVGYGDPATAGASSAVSVFESNGGLVSVYLRDATCASDVASIYLFDREGNFSDLINYGASALVNLESPTSEIDSEANIRRFKVVDGQYVRDENGYLIEDSYGRPLQVGRYLDCTFYRGEEALGYGTRQWQTAANGPSGDDPAAVMFDSASYNNRYLKMYGMFNALWSGSAYTDSQGTTYIPAGNANRALTSELAQTVAQGAALETNVMSVVYDATSLTMWVAFDGGTGSSWSKAADTEFVTFDMAVLFDWQ